MQKTLNKAIKKAEMHILHRQHEPFHGKAQHHQMTETTVYNMNISKTTISRIINHVIQIET